MPGVDAAAWNAAVDTWMILAKREGKKASTETANAVKSEAKRLLNMYPHAPHTKTPSPPMVGPVGKIKGNLRREIYNTQRYEGFDVAVGPTIRYARIQELGGRCGKNHRTHLPPRPYWIYAHTIVMEWQRGLIYYDHWLASQQAVTT